MPKQVPTISAIERYWDQEDELESLYVQAKSKAEPLKRSKDLAASVTDTDPKYRDIIQYLVWCRLTGNPINENEVIPNRSFPYLIAFSDYLAAMKEVHEIEAHIARVKQLIREELPAWAQPEKDRQISKEEMPAWARQ